jgi:chitin synthase
LEERVNTIIDEIDNFNRKGMSSYVANNRDFPPSI